MRRDVEDTRARLVAAATAEFAELGIAGARVNRIAEQAGVNKERIYGIFGSKEALFDVVLGAAMDRHVAELGLPGEDVAGWVGEVHDFYRANPELLRLLMWEALQAGGRPSEIHRTERYTAKVEAFAAARGVAPDAENASALLGLIVLAMLPTLFPQLAGSLVGPYAEGADVEGIVRDRMITALGGVLGG
ncbi:TetR/AcrR family transcriptional regulator [Pseudonocardia xishanensis]|uniref:TetR family transcriptional regulator n=1 Tax=Pseudonocardia xishanensis TaxID=630995 RepID=A0ABP8S0J5_9PSEU